MSSPDLPGLLRRGSGYVYLRAARLNALHQLSVMALHAPVLSMKARARIIASSAGAIDRASRCLCKGADVRSEQVVEAVTQPWISDAVSDTLVNTIIVGVLVGSLIDQVPFLCV